MNSSGDEQSELETAAMLSVDDLPEAPIAVENPGGTRIENRDEPDSSELVTVIGLGGKRVELHRLAAAFWFRLVDSARADGLRSPLLLPVSGFRTSKRQEELWSQAVKRYRSEEAARRWVAKPGQSAHHSGRAIDCWLGTPTDSKNVRLQRDSDAWAWLNENAERFGFYPYPDEPWHWEYNPPWSDAT